MDLISGFKSELFRPLAILVVPGSIALAPFFLLVAANNPEIGRVSNENPFGMVGILLILATASGLILENVGSRIERGIDQCMVERYLPAHDDLWCRYLELKTDSELVAQRYLRTVVTRTKFVLSFLPALLIFLLGFLVLDIELQVWTRTSVSAAVIFVVLLVCFLFVEAIRLIEVLAEARCRVLAALGKPCGNPEGVWPGVWMFAGYVLLHVIGRHPEKAKFLMQSWYPKKTEH
jgi:hypothetical protein